MVFSYAGSSKNRIESLCYAFVRSGLSFICFLPSPKIARFARGLIGLTREEDPHRLLSQAQVYLSKTLFFSAITFIHYMTKYFSPILFIAISMTPCIGAEISHPQHIQDTAMAFKYFEEELNFTAVPGSVKKVTEGKMDGVIIDLRKKEHFDKGHIPGAINLPFDQYDGFEGQHSEFPGLSKDKINYVYCYELLCNLSLKAAKQFAALGYPVKEVKGGFTAWEEHGYPIEK